MKLASTSTVIISLVVLTRGLPTRHQPPGGGILSLATTVSVQKPESEAQQAQHSVIRMIDATTPFTTITQPARELPGSVLTALSVTESRSHNDRDEDGSDHSLQKGESSEVQLVSRMDLPSPSALGEAVKGTIGSTSRLKNHALTNVRREPLFDEFLTHRYQNKRESQGRALEDRDKLEELHRLLPKGKLSLRKPSKTRYPRLLSEEESALAKPGQYLTVAQFEKLRVKLRNAHSYDRLRREKLSLGENLRNADVATASASSRTPDTAPSSSGNEVPLPIAHVDITSLGGAVDAPKLQHDAATIARQLPPSPPRVVQPNAQTTASTAPRRPANTASDEEWLAFARQRLLEED